MRRDQETALDAMKEKMVATIGSDKLKREAEKWVTFNGSNLPKLHSDFPTSLKIYDILNAGTTSR